MADDSEQIGQDENDAPLHKAQSGDGGPPAGPSDPARATPASSQGANVMLDEGEIEALMQQAGSAASAPTSPDTAPRSDTAAATPFPSVPAEANFVEAAAQPVVSQSDIDVLLNQAEAALASIDQDTRTLPEGVRAFKLEDFSGTPASTEAATLDLMRDVQLDVTIELGRTHMHLEEVLQLQKGAVVPLDKLAGDPVDIFINGRLIARGEVLVLNDNFCVRVAELITGENACA
jgi:flagellar motor switch protein FliN/FliY